MIYWALFVNIKELIFLAIESYCLCRSYLFLYYQYVMNARIVALIDLVTYFIHDHFLFQVKVTQTIAGFDDPQEVRKLKRGDYFGEKSLLR